VSYVVLKLVAGRLREVHPVMLILAGLLVLFYGVIKGF
jgi:xanthine/uracil/vitamin C permease (AzgA family)